MHGKSKSKSNCNCNCKSNGNGNGKGNGHGNCNGNCNGYGYGYGYGGYLLLDGGVAVVVCVGWVSEGTFIVGRMVGFVWSCGTGFGVRPDWGFV